jgi:hypothetical protein
LVNPRFFVQATRESGYRSTTHALAELVDNSIQAKASQIHIGFEDNANDPTDISVYILDNGTGMDEQALDLALQFGGSTRFGERDGIGRFGMGLPNASVSQCRRLEVYTRKPGGRTSYTYLDLDEIENGIISEPGFLVPQTTSDWPLPAMFSEYDFPSGTLIIWKKCDRLNPRNFDGLRKKAAGHLGQAFRNFIYPSSDGVSARAITVNGQTLRPFDPLYLDPRSEVHGAELRGHSTHDISIPGRKGETSRVSVKYSILPIEEWQSLAPRDKSNKRISANRGFSIVRNGRELEVTDRFFLMGQNEAEGRVTNNDAWWGCEISFSAELDEVMGVTHTKQSVNPNLQLLQALREEITATIGTLRNEYEQRRLKKTPNKTHQSEEIAARSDQFLPPIPEFSQQPEEFERNLSEYLDKTSRDGETKLEAHHRVLKKRYTIELESAKEGPLYRTAYLGENTLVYLNTDHPFYSEIYSSLDDSPSEQIALELFLFALARGERQAGPDGQIWYRGQRTVWSQALWAFLNS